MRLTELTAGQKLSCPACGGEAQWNPARQALICAYCGTESPYEVKADGEIVEHDLVAALQAIPREARAGRMNAGPCAASIARPSASSVRRSRARPVTSAAPPRSCRSRKPATSSGPKACCPLPSTSPTRATGCGSGTAPASGRPNNLGSKALTDTLSGVYLPYWTFDAQVSADYTAEGGRVTQNAKGERQVHWYPVSGHVQHFFDDTLVCASRGVHPRLVQAVEPFPTASERLKPYDPGYLSGWTVERYQLDLVAGAQRGRERMMDAVRQMCARDIRADLHRNLQVSAHFDRQTFKHVLLPVWLVGYRYGSKDYQVVVNGATGQVAGEYPKSWVKIALAVLAAIIVLVIVASLEGR